jgi:hypothetical protein
MQLCKSYLHAKKRLSVKPKNVLATYTRKTFFWFSIKRISCKTFL